MPNYRSIVVAQENDPTWWYFAQVANTLPELESQDTYDAIDRVRKSTWNAARANDELRIVADNATGNTISVVSYRQTAAPAFIALRPAARRKPKAKKTKKTKPRKTARKISSRKKSKAPARKKTKARKK